MQTKRATTAVLQIRALLAVLAPLVFAGLGCQSGKPPPLTAPAQASVTVDHFSGTPLSGPMPTAVQVGQPEDALALKVTLLALEKMPNDALQPVAGHAKLIAVTQGGTPVLPVAQLSLGARIGTQEQAAAFRQILQSTAVGQIAEMKSVQGALPAGATVVFAASEPKADITRRVAVEISRPSDGGAAAANNLRFAVLVEDLAAPARADQADESGASTRPSSPAAPVFQRETVLMDDIPLEAGALQAILLVPFRFEQSRTQAVAFLIDVAPGSPDPAHVQAVQQCVADLQKSAATAAKRPEIALLRTDDYSGLETATQALARPQTRRAALVYLTTQSHAPICGDVVLACDDDVLAALADRVTRQVAASGSAAPSRSPESFGWTLDVATLGMLTELDNNNKLPAELSAVLARHCGEVGRHASSMEEVIKGVGTRKDLENRLIAENLIFLEDNSPASRVRAYDWLRAMNRAPEGYDPLGPDKQRRQALDKALSTPTLISATTAPTTQQVPP
ncbi:MAG TPA: hypothetical protein VH518_23565 [Tepidisphaeraceae bacterium]|jgi:hypothetical protein